MTSGAKTGGRERLRAALVALVLAAAAGPAAALELAELMAMLGQRRSGEARFTEERTVAGLDRALQSSGTVRFTAPDRFARVTERPRPESMEVQGNQVTLRRGDRTRRTTLDAVPELAALVDGLRGTLTGDAATLQRHFDTAVGGDRRLWTLTLTPRDERLRLQVPQIQLAGTAGEVRSVEVHLAGGDRSLMQLEPFAASAPGRTTP